MTIGRIMINWSPKSITYSDFEKVVIEKGIIRIFSEGVERQSYPLAGALDDRGLLSISQKEENHG